MLTYEGHKIRAGLDWSNPLHVEQGKLPILAITGDATPAQSLPATDSGQVSET